MSNTKRNLDGTFAKVYEVNQDFFKTIDTQEKAYVLGFLYADGCNHIYGDHRYISVALLEQDIDILDKITKAMEYTNPHYVKVIQKSNLKVKYQMLISSSTISKDLENLGMVANKSLILTFPTFIPKELMSHFIRGYFDGDGCVWEGKPKIDSKGRYIHNVKFTFTGNFEFINALLDYLISILGFRKTKLNFSKAKNPNNNTSANVCTMEYSGKKLLLSFYNFLYLDSIIYGNRKKEKFENIICADSKKLLFETRLTAGTPETVISSQDSSIVKEE